MATISELSGDLVGEILSRLPLTSLRAVRSTCKTWNTLSKNQLFVKSAASKQFLGFMMMDSKVCSLRFDLQGIHRDNDLVDPSIKQVSLLDKVEVSQVFHCDGLLLCVTKDHSWLVVWNPYLGQYRCIQQKSKSPELYVYALGYDNKYRTHKILRFSDNRMYFSGESVEIWYEIYDFNSNLWRVLDVNPDWYVDFRKKGVSLKGNTYFVANKTTKHGSIDFLLCFDFTAESFGPHLPLPFHSSSLFVGHVSLSCVRDEQLAVLHQQAVDIMEIWVTTMIDPYAVYWSKFLKVDITPPFFKCASFFIDEENQVVVFDDAGYNMTKQFKPYVCQRVHIIGQDEILKSTDIGKRCVCNYISPLVCSSYTPSLVQL